MPEEPAGLGEYSVLVVLTIDFLDVGEKEYGDALLCRLDETTILIDGAHLGDQVGRGGHPSIPDQIGDALHEDPPFDIDLLIISHAHQDHIGCLPFLVLEDVVRPSYALVADPDLGWGTIDGGDPLASIESLPAASIALVLREEPPLHVVSQEEAKAYVEAVLTLRDRYDRMLAQLDGLGCEVYRFGVDNHEELEAAFAAVGLKILGPSAEQLRRCAELIHDRLNSVATVAASLPVQATATTQEVIGYALDLATEGVDRPGPLVNLQSVVVSLEYEGVTCIFAGDMQLADPEVADSQLQSTVAELKRNIFEAGPYTLAKLSHHGSCNAFSEDVFEVLGRPKILGLCAGANSTRHPHPSVLDVLKRHATSLQWVRTDTNGRATVTHDGSHWQIDVSVGKLNDASHPDPLRSGFSAPTPKVLGIP